jgi:uncharacterized protein YegJ (DUF2314 family)
MSANSENNDPIIWIEGEDPEFVKAIHKAQATFVKDFADPLAREEQADQCARVDAAIVKIFFPDPADPLKGEHLWVNFHRWTGQWIVGELTGEPNLPNLRVGQRVRVHLERLSDWVLVIGGKATGGFTLPLITARMPEADVGALTEQPPFCWFSTSTGD